MRPCNPHVDGDLSCGVIGYGPWIVVVSPETGVVVELRDIIHFIFGFDVAVLSRADIDPDPTFIKILKIKAAVIDGFMRSVDGDAACASPHAEFLAALILLRVEVADACWDFPHVAHIDDLDASDSS